MPKLKRWVLFCDEYPGGMIYDHRNDALQESADLRSQGIKAYVRIKSYTQEFLDELPWE
jgi:hypothetical protein